MCTAPGIAALFDLAGIADVDRGHRVLGEQAVQFGDRDPRRRLHQIGQFGRKHAVMVDAEIADGVVGADAGQPQRRVLLLAGIGDQRDLVPDLGDHAAGLGEAAVEPDVDRAAQVPGGEVLDAAGVQHPYAASSAARICAGLSAGIVRD